MGHYDEYYCPDEDMQTEIMKENHEWEAYCRWLESNDGAGASEDNEMRVSLAVNGNVLPKKDNAVDSPSHYQFFDGTEAIEIIARSLTLEEFRGYCMGNKLKYKLRAGHKDSVEQDLAKADKYDELFEKYKGETL